MSGRTMRDAERLLLRLENALAAMDETSRDAAPFLDALARLAEAAEAGTPELAGATLPPTEPPQNDETTRRERDGCGDAERRHRRRNWGALDKAVAWDFFKEHGILGGGKDEKRKRITPKKMNAFLAIVRQKGFGPFKRYSLADMGVTFESLEDVKSCLKAIRDEYRRTECTYFD